MASTTVDENDRILMARLIRADEAAFTQFFDSTHEPLRRFALARTGGDETAADALLMSTYSEAVQHMDSWGGKVPLLTWLTALCESRALPEAVQVDGAPLRETIHAEWQAVTTRRAQKRVLTSLAFAIAVATIILLFNCPGGLPPSS